MVRLLGCGGKFPKHDVTRKMNRDCIIGIGPERIHRSLGLGQETDPAAWQAGNEEMPVMDRSPK
jgi:hypothetical protein